MLEKNLNLWFPLTFKYATAGLPPTIQFISENFIRPPTTKSVGHTFFIQTMEPELETTDMTRQNKWLFDKSAQPTIYQK